MVLKVLTKKSELHKNVESTCLFCEGTLLNYVESLPKTYTDYDIQRGIITNVYLDKLTQTILYKKFIPPIVLVANNDLTSYTVGKDIILTDFKILDGLQRTFRIKYIFDTIVFFIKTKKEDEAILSDTKLKLSKKYKKSLENINSNTTIFKTIIEYYNNEKPTDTEMLSLFSELTQWFEVWLNLDKTEQINKMLVLNAGHKTMDLKHQLELLFLNVVKEEQLARFIRAKKSSSSTFYKIKKAGDFHLSHMISAILAFHAQKPINIDAKLFQKLQESIEQELEKIKFYFNEQQIEMFIDFTNKIDDIFNAEYKDLGISWLGRETILMGLFAASGKYYYQNKQSFSSDEEGLVKEVENLQIILSEIIGKIKINIRKFKLNEFNLAKTVSIDITKVNIGNVFKYSVFNATSKILCDNPRDINWDYLFKLGNKADNDCQ